MARAAAALVVGAIALGAAATAQAGSIAFVRGGDLWLTSDDGSLEHRVTAGGNYKWVTQADDGTLFAGEGVTMYRFDQQGKQSASPISIGTLIDPDVTPDGSKIAYWYGAVDGSPRVMAARTDGTTAGWDNQSGMQPSWYDNDTLMYSNGAGYLNTGVAGQGQ